MAYQSIEAIVQTTVTIGIAAAGPPTSGPSERTPYASGPGRATRARGIRVGPLGTAGEDRQAWMSTDTNTLS